MASAGRINGSVRPGFQRSMDGNVVAYPPD